MFITVEYLDYKKSTFLNIGTYVASQAAFHSFEINIRCNRQGRHPQSTESHGVETQWADSSQPIFNGLTDNGSK